MTPSRSVGRPGESEGRNSSSAAARAAAPASLWAPSRTTSGRPASGRAVAPAAAAGRARPSGPSTNSSRRPGQRAASRPRRSGARRLRRCRPPPARPRSPAPRRVGRLVPAQQRDVQLPEFGMAQGAARRRVQAHHRQRGHLDARAPRGAPHGCGSPPGPRPLAPVTARSPRLMMAAFSRPMRGEGGAEAIHVVPLHVGDGGHPAVPGVGGVEPPAEADLDDRHVDALAGRTRRRRRPSAPRTRSAGHDAASPARPTRAPR